MKTGPRGRDKQEDIKSPRICRNLGEGFEHMWGEGDGIQTGTVVAMDRDDPCGQLGNKCNSEIFMYRFRLGKNT